MTETDKTEPDNYRKMLKRWKVAAGSDWHSKFQLRLNMHRDLYGASENPLDVWQGILYAQALNEPLPDWILEYLASSAANIFDLMHHSMQGKRPTPAHIANALNMVRQGSGTIFPNESEWDWTARGGQVAAMIEAGHQETYAIDAVAETEGVSSSTVRRDWKRFQKVGE